MSVLVALYKRPMPEPAVPHLAGHSGRGREGTGGTGGLNGGPGG